MMKTHIRDVMTHQNTGMNIPTCQVKMRLSRLLIGGFLPWVMPEFVTAGDIPSCAHCARRHPRVAFHLAHGGYSWNPAKESQAAGKLRCAIVMATAEMRAIELEGMDLLRFIERHEDMDPADSFEDERDIENVRSGAWEWSWFALEMRDTPEGKWHHVASVGGVAYKRGDGYDRVIRAELAVEANLPEHITPVTSPRYV